MSPKRPKRGFSKNTTLSKIKNSVSQSVGQLINLLKKIYTKVHHPKEKDLVSNGYQRLAQFRRQSYDSPNSSGFSELILVWVRDHGKHLSIFIVASIVLLGNLLSVEPKILQQSGGSVSPEIMAKAPRETTDLGSTIKTLGFFTPELQEDPTKIAQKMTTEIKLVTSGDNFLVKPHVLGVKIAKASNESSPKGWYISYQIKKGESIGSVANKFGINTATILSANSIADADLVTPGKWIRVPRQNGVMHTVARGETFSELVAYYKGSLSKTASLNNLKGSSSNTIYIGQKLFIVGGKKPVTHLASDTSSSGYSSGYSRPSYSGGGNRFPYGYCTWYVASKRYVPWSGNANQWLYNARAMGYSTGRSPQVGAIMVTNESWWGHVAYVEAVHGNSVTISEMNYAGWGRVNYRTLSAWYGQYIY